MEIITLMLATSEPLSNFFTACPGEKDRVARQLTQAFQSISDKEFRVAKGCIFLCKELMPLLRKKKLDKQKFVPIMEVTFGDANQAKGNVQENNAGGRHDGTRNKMTLALFWSALKALFAGQSDMESIFQDDLLRHATDAAQRITDSQFLTQLGKDLDRFAQYDDLLKLLADKAKERATVHLKVNINRTVMKLTAMVHGMQEDGCKKEIKHESAKRADEELAELRVKLIKDVNNLSTQTRYSCVPCPFLIIDRDSALMLFADIHCSSITRCNLEGGPIQVSDGLADIPWPVFNSMVGWSSATPCQISGSRESQEDPRAIYTVHLMNLTNHDQHSLQLDPSFIPSPLFRFRHTFTLPLGYSVECVFFLCSTCGT